MQKEYLFVIASGILSGLVIFFGKLFTNAGFSLFELSTLPYLLVIPILLPFILFRKESAFKKELLPIWLLYGFVSIFIVCSQFGALLLGLPVSLLVLLLYTQPLWTVIFSSIFLKEKITKTTILASILVLIGIGILVNPFSLGKTSIPLLGVIIGLFGGIALSVWIMVGGIASKKQADPIATKFYEVFFMIIFLFILYFILTPFLKNPSITRFSLHWPITIFILLFAFSFFAQAINHILYLKGVKKVPTSEAGIILLLEPISAAILAALFFHEAITVYVVVGGFLILLGNYFVLSNKKTG